MRKFISVLLLVGAVSFVGCEKSKEDQAKDKVDEAGKSAKEAIDKVTK